MDIEKKYANFIPKQLKLQCIRCDKILECDKHGAANAESYPCVYGGVVFRSSGQYGSTVLDCGIGIPHDYSTEVQIILCDQCMEDHSQYINMWKDKRPIIVSNYEQERLTQWSDWSTFAEMKLVSGRKRGSDTSGDGGSNFIDIEENSDFDNDAWFDAKTIWEKEQEEEAIKNDGTR